MDREDGARRQRRIVVDGPLAPFVVGLRGELARQGYATDTICRQPDAGHRYAHRDSG